MTIAENSQFVAGPIGTSHTSVGFVAGSSGIPASAPKNQYDLTVSKAKNIKVSKTSLLVFVIMKNKLVSDRKEVRAKSIREQSIRKKIELGILELDLKVASITLAKKFQEKLLL